jgi:hypothetical protein
VLVDDTSSAELAGGPVTLQVADRSRVTSVLPRLVVLVLAIGLIAGCGARSGDVHSMGAPSPVANLGPTAVVSPTLPALAPRMTSDASASASAPASASLLQPLVDSITAALVDAERVPPNVEVSQSADAGNQVIVSWIVNTDPNDAKAKENVRTDAVKIMTVVKASNIDYGSVLLAATGTVLQEGKKKDTDVVRAKYTGGLVRSTDWAAVPPATIFTLCDDKPAVIAPAFS